MRKITAFIMLLAFAACNNHTSTNDSSPATKVDSSKAEVSYPYPIGYSSKFEFADPEKSKMVLDLWKSYDNNTLDNVKDHFADTVEMIFPGFRMRTGRDSIIATAKAGRNMSNSVISTVDVVMSVKSTDKGGNWVLVWGDEMRTDKKNKTDTVAIHEVWGLNKDGKIEFMQQYASKK
jgi:hypothetical protein